MLTFNLRHFLAFMGSSWLDGACTQLNLYRQSGCCISLKCITTTCTAGVHFPTLQPQQHSVSTPLADNSCADWKCFRTMIHGMPVAATAFSDPSSGSSNDWTRCCMGASSQIGYGWVPNLMQAALVACQATPCAWLQPTRVPVTRPQVLKF